MKAIANLVVLILVAYFIWMFKNTPWASTTFLGYLILLIVEGVLSGRFEKTGSRVRSTVNRQATRSASSARDSAGWGATTGSSSVATRNEPSITFAGVLGAILFATGFMLLADNAVGLKWFDFEAAGQPGWLSVTKWFAEGLCFLIMFLTPIVVGVYFAIHFSSAWSNRHTYSSGEPRAGLDILGSAAGFLLGVLLYGHLALAPVLHEWLVGFA